MQDDESPNPPPRYWNRRRILLAGVIVVAILGPFVAATAYTWRVSGPQEPSPEDSAGLTHGRQGPPPPLLYGFDTENLLIPENQIHRGAMLKDDIPALTEPQTVPVAQADFMAPADRVIGVTINGESRAYPINILNRHECVNDVLGGVPVAVIFCPLCDSVSVVDRRLDGQTYEFGISGLLHNSNVLLYDRTDDALWSQVSFMAVSGPHSGKALRHIDGWRLTQFELWTRDHPDSKIVSDVTGHWYLYSQNPYAAYLKDDKLLFPVTSRDDRLSDKAPVVGIRWGEVTRAYPVSLVVESPDGRILDRIGDGTVELVAEAGRDTVRVSTAPDDAKVVYTFWFAWAAFYPDTQLYAPAAGGATTAAAARAASGEAN